MYELLLNLSVEFSVVSFHFWKLHLIFSFIDSYSLVKITNFSSVSCRFFSRFMNILIIGTFKSLIKPISRSSVGLFLFVLCFLFVVI